MNFFLVDYWPTIKVPRTTLNVCQRLSNTLGSSLEKHGLKRKTVYSGPAIPTVSGRVQMGDEMSGAHFGNKEQKYEPKGQRDNFGLYALKCDRNAAKKGPVLNRTCPSNLASIQRKPSPDLHKSDGFIVSREMTHEKFEPLEKNTLQPPPRRKRKSIINSTSTHAITESVSNYSCPTDNLGMQPQQSVDIFIKSRDSQFHDFDNLFGSTRTEETPKVFSRIDKIVFQNQFIPNSYELPAKSINSIQEEETDSSSCDRPVLDQLTISKHYLNEDVLVWTF